LIEEIRRKGITDLDILQFFDRMPRHEFLPEGVWNRAYEDGPVPIGYGQTSSQPSLQAFCLSVLKPRSDESVLEIGTGSGYLTALLSLMSDRVYSVERVRELSQRARQTLDAQGLRNVALLVGDGSIGWRKYAPFPVVVVHAASPSVPPALLDQLADPGRMLIPIGSRDQQDLILVEKEKGATRERPVQEACSFVPLLGRFAWDVEGS
jgi:protein-L-isoaspartate(D-aspartate) O-methyltransferase